MFGEPTEIAEAFVKEGGPVSGSKWPIWLGACLTLPGALFVGASLLKYGADVDALYDGFFATAFDRSSKTFELLSVILFVGGPLAAIVIMLATSLDLHVTTARGGIQASLGIHLTFARLLLLLASGLVISALVGYLLLENLPCLVGGRVNC